jgi:hypothetical protein
MDEQPIETVKRRLWHFTPPEVIMGIILSIVTGAVAGALMVFVVTNNTYSQQVKGLRSELNQIFIELGVKRINGELPPPKKEKPKG